MRAPHIDGPHLQISPVSQALSPPRRLRSRRAFAPRSPRLVVTMAFTAKRKIVKEGAKVGEARNSGGSRLGE